MVVLPSETSSADPLALMENSLDLAPTFPEPWRVAWTRGRDCQPLAEALGRAAPRPVQSDWGRACVDDRIDLIVARRLTNLDLVPVVVPHAVELNVVDSVTVAVGAGPHSDLAATIAARLAQSLDVPGAALTVYRSEREVTEAHERVERFERSHPILEGRALAAPAAADLVETLSPATLLVLGAPGGSWLQRQFFGPGHRLTVTAPGGAVVVRSAPRRIFHAAVDPVGSVVGPHLAVSEVLRLFAQPAIPVADGGRLVGIVRLAALRRLSGERLVGQVMETPVAIGATEPLEAAKDLSAFLDGGPIPVVDRTGMLVGIIPAPERPDPGLDRR